MSEDLIVKTDMNHFSIEIAGLVIGIDAISTGVYGLCIKYLSDKKPIFRVSITEDELQQEIEKNRLLGFITNEVFLESIGIYRKIAEIVLSYDILLMHGVVIAHNTNAFMLIASSGTGKTTHARQWLLKDKDAFILNGDKPLIKIESDDLLACGTPWNGKEGMGTNTIVQLGAIVILVRNNDNYIEEISFATAYPYLISHVHRPEDVVKMKSTLELLQKIKGKVRFYKFYMNNYKADCFEVCYNALVRE